MIQDSLAHYRILGKLGSGGMGDVYRAEDTKLKRQVAIKVLPDAFAKDSERMKRFEREAQVLASLNHPNIAAIYGLEESDGQRFLVLELAEGEDLADRLRRGLILVDEAIQIAKQMAEGLEQAHEKGIIHRDLKPANVKVSRDGVVKILDFGLAKALAGDIQEISSRNSQSPTLARPATVAGVILGTPAYMSPEQARGKTVDRRADIWAVGAVLYEMLTSRRPFEDETEEPNFDALPDATPLPIRRLLRRCLERDPKRRLQAIGEARIQLDDVPDGAIDEVPSRPVWFPWALATLGIALALVALWAPWRRLAPPRASRSNEHRARRRRRARCELQSRDSRHRLFPGRRPSRLRGKRGGRRIVEDLSPAARSTSGVAPCRHRRGTEPLLFPRRRVDRFLRGWEAQENPPHRWTRGRAGRCLRSSRRELERRRHPHLYSFQRAST
jgi:serine/threonine-protein kinase